MADILIRGMEMPETCDECPMYTCMHNHADCPLVELPEHGDLIDRDALMRNLLPMQTNPRFQRIKRGFAKAIAVAKDLLVIVPADKEESK